MVFEIIMVVVVVILVVARPRIEIVFCRGTQPEHDAGINLASLTSSTGNLARRLGQHRLARLGKDASDRPGRPC